MKRVKSSRTRVADDVDEEPEIAADPSATKQAGSLEQ
ncbi:hypothetical protein TIFTF001_040843 [Ficus carica]|uniref:Uncharacterized protein n=1 Tax=Ficus carica TaxID=3494 RepID=A0AA88CLS6_FICCA|nr:hypothetical protein TIFTF001_040843 [Ficus carica]